MGWIQTTSVILQLLLVLVAIRLKIILPPARAPAAKRERGTQTHLLIVLGSGGHTAEMLSMLRNAVMRAPSRTLLPATPPPNLPKSQYKAAIEKALAPLDWRLYTHRTWVVSSGDGFSAQRAKEFEDEMSAHYARLAYTGTGKRKSKTDLGSYEVVTVPRARKIHQSLVTTPVSALRCLWASLRVLLDRRRVDTYPDLMLTNGPATATIVVFASVLLRFVNWRGASSSGKMRTVYVESWARVRKLSLSGRLLSWVADRVLVQWEHLAGAENRGEFVGVLV